MARLHSTARTTFELILADVFGSADVVNTPAAPNCSVTDKFHSIDGICNNVEYPHRAAANTAFKRLQPAEYEDGISLPVGYDQ